MSTAFARIGFIGTMQCQSSKGPQVQVRFTDHDYKRVWVVLPSGPVCAAELGTPPPLINPNKQTHKTVSVALLAGTEADP